MKKLKCKHCPISGCGSKFLAKLSNHLRQVHELTELEKNIGCSSLNYKTLTWCVFTRMRLNPGHNWHQGHKGHLFSPVFFPLGARGDLARRSRGKLCVGNALVLQVRELQEQVFYKVFYLWITHVTIFETQFYISRGIVVTPSSNTFLLGKSRKTHLELVHKYTCYCWLHGNLYLVLNCFVWSVEH